MIARSKKYNWRSHWLSLRQFERASDQAAWLKLLGRSQVYFTPPHVAHFQVDDIAVWMNTYFRAVIRASSFPTVRLTADYIKAAHALVLRNLINAQISYYTSETKFQEAADEFLERYILRCVGVAFLFNAAVLLISMPVQAIGSWSGSSSLSMVTDILAQIVGATAPAAAVIGGLLPTIATALSAIRSHGEYAQIAARYRGTMEGLQSVQRFLTARLPDRHPDYFIPPLRSQLLASKAHASSRAAVGSYPKALRRLKRTGELKDTVRHRTSKYLNNRIEADHGALKRLIRPTRGNQ